MLWQSISCTYLIIIFFIFRIPLQPMEYFGYSVLSYFYLYFSSFSLFLRLEVIFKKKSKILLKFFLKFTLKHLFIFKNLGLSLEEIEMLYTGKQVQKSQLPATESYHRVSSIANLKATPSIILWYVLKIHCTGLVTVYVF